MASADPVRFARARIVDEYGEASLLEYLQRTSRADDGADPVASSPCAVTNPHAGEVDRGEGIRTDGGIVESERTCARCDADARPGSHFCVGHGTGAAVDRGDGVRTDGGEDTDVQGALDNDFDDAERSYDELVAEALADVPTEPMQGGVAIDLVTRQAVFVRQQSYETCREHYESEGYDLATYKMHPWLPGIGPDNAVYECVYIDGNPQNAHKPGRTYDFPEARLMALPLPMAWGAFEVGEI